MNDMRWLMCATINEIEMQMNRLYWNKQQKEIISPFKNTGAEYCNDTFKVRAYSWDDVEDDVPNFEYKDLKIWWYKHSNRGLNWSYKNQKDAIVPSEFLASMIADCIDSMERDWNIK